MISRRIQEKIASFLSREKGTIFKDPGGKISVCLVYPNTYHVGMSNLGFQGIYTLLNDRKDTVCERAFLPDEEDVREYARTGMEIVSLESMRPLGEFDIIAFSVSFENDYPNILRILSMSRITPRARDRKGAGPLLIMGGACAFYNPEPVADFFDICFAGEAEEMLSEFMETYRHSTSRADLYEKARDIEGAYLPGLYEIRYSPLGEIAKRAAYCNAPEKVKRRYVKDISAHSLRQSIVTSATEFSDMYLAEAMRGCPWNCRFCVAGHVYKPVRRKDVESLRNELGNAALLTGRIGLIAPSLTDYPRAMDILCMEGVEFSITSLRADRKSADLISLLKDYRSVSIAPEAGTERLRKVVDKRITEEDIIETSRLILACGIQSLRLYFMAGLPTETERDIQGIVDLVEKIRGLSAKGKIVLTVSTFVPKPFTPFQWHPMEKMEVVKSRLKRIKNGLGTLKGVRVFHDVPKYAYMQGLFAMGDRRI
ncbi:MAG TPA: radical SAM protein, partial [Thermodesulfovibrionales bacterium]|nr:radical SAM protein [Thermodesulfovibrionales bacterium]